jgi:5-methyltetrahydrofolate--homocysteine methyltransferase
MPSEILARIRRGEVLLADGGMGSLLLDAGLAPGQCPEAWNLERPDLIAEIARAYADAGAMLVQANTFGGSSLKLAAYGLAERTEEINGAAVAAARRGAGGKAWVYGSCGPSGVLLQPYGDVAPEAVRESFRRQLAALAEAGVDAIIVETMTDLREAELAVTTAREVAPDLPIVATMTFDSTPRGFFTIMGVDVAAAAAGLAAAGADIVGANCGQGSEVMVEVARAFAACADHPFAIQPNAGLPRIVEGRAVYTETPTFMAAQAEHILEAGAAIIGGCCGTTPEHVRALRAVVERRRA